jgi:cell division protein FtsB
MLRFIVKILINKYFLALVAFVVWMIFFDNNSLKRQRILNARIGEIKGMGVFYTTEIAKTNKAIYELETNLETVEKYAREKYMMKRDSEDVYIVTRE